MNFQLKLQKSDWIAITIVIPFIQLLCLWCIDILVSAMINHPDSLVTNGWNTLPPLMSYHIALYVIILTLVFLILISIHHILKEERNAPKS